MKIVPSLAIPKADSKIAARITAAPIYAERGKRGSVLKGSMVRGAKR